MIKFFGLLVIIFLLSTSCLERKNNKLDEQVAEKKINDTTGLALSAHMYYQSNRYVEAFNEYSLLIKYDSLNGKNYYRRAYSLTQLNRPEESISDFLKAAELGYKPCEAYYSLALMNYSIFLNDSLAIIYCEKCLKIDPNYKKAQELLQKLKHKNGSV
jgi:tetratricopeptide (TPR) repeat protein